MSKRNDRDIKTTLSLVGADAYKQSVAQINDKLRLNRAQMELLDEQYKDNADSAEYLEKKEKLLQDARDLHAQKCDKAAENLAKLTKAENDAAAAVEESKKILNEKKAILAELENAEQKDAAAIEQARQEVEYQTNALKNSEKQQEKATKKVNDATIAHTKAEKKVAESTNKIKDNTKATEKLGQAQTDSGAKTGLFGESISDLTSKLGINLPAGADKALGAMNDMSTGMVAGMAAVGAAAALAMEGVKALVNETIEVAARADDIITKSVVTGMSTDQVQFFQYIADLVDTDFSILESAGTKLIQTMDKVKDGNKEATKTFRELGVSVLDSHGQLRDSQAVFDEVCLKLGRMRNETERNAAAQDIFGRSARELNPYIEALASGGVAQLRDEFDRLGISLNGAELDSLGGLDDDVHRLDLALEAASNKIAEQYAPSLEGVMEQAADTITGISDAFLETGIIDIVSSLTDATSDLLGVTGDLVSLIIPLDLTGGYFNDLSTVLKEVTGFIKDCDEAVKDLHTDLDDLFGEGTTSKLVKSTWQDLASRGLSGLFGTSSNTMLKGLSSIAGYIDLGKLLESLPKHAAGTDYFSGGLTWVGERGAEIVSLPRGSKIYSNEQSRQIASGGNTPTVVNINLQGANIDEIKRIVDYYKGYPTSRRKG